jgi:hypothetical protein
MAKSEKNRRYEKVIGGFFSLPHRILDSAAYRGLSPLAKVLLIELCRQYNGRNNGHLHATYKWLKKRGWVSCGSIQKAKNELQESGLIQLTRQGGLIIGSSYFALTWLSIEDFRGLDLDFNTYQKGRWQDLMTLNGSSAVRSGSI